MKLSKNSVNINGCSQHYLFPHTSGMNLLSLLKQVAAIANKMNVSSIKNYVFRNYHLPAGSKSHYQGAVKYRCWEALRASSAAPGYFEEFQLDDNVFQVSGEVLIQV